MEDNKMAIASVSILISNYGSKCLSGTGIRGENKCSQQGFWKEFAYSLIFNTELEEESMSPRSLRKQRRSTDNDHHELIPLQPFWNFRASRIIKTKTRCTQQKWHCRMRQVNTYCKCTPGVFWCSQCFVDHVSNALTGEVLDD